MAQPNKPVIILAFSNDQDVYLQMIDRERKNIFNTLRQHHDLGYIQVEKEGNTGIKDIFFLFNHYAGRIAIFHYGGHASGTHLQLEAGVGKAEMADAIGLAQLMGQEKALQLVFLNGCATRDQVEKLFACGVKAVIATSVRINDDMATEFAEQFYHALANQAPIQRAFNTAKAFVTTRYGKEKEVSEFRALSWAGKKEISSSDMPWGLYININHDGDEALAWKLPEWSAHTIIIRGEAITGRSVPINTELIETLFNAITQYGVTVGNRRDLRAVRQEVINSFPAPVGEQLRKLFNSTTDINDERLRQLVMTYDTVVELVCFTVLSQLWDARYKNPALTISDEHGVELNSFFALSAESQPTFNYIKLIAAVGEIFRENNIAAFVAELATLREILQQENFDRAYRFMEEMRAELRGEVAAKEIESFCVQAEKHLGFIMSAFAFLVKYKLATIKRIDIIKARHKAPEYRHNKVALDRITAGLIDEPEVYHPFTDSQSVIWLKTTADATDYLSLSPFIIDENALTGNRLSKLFFFSYYDAANEVCYFRFIENAEDKLIVSAARYNEIKEQFEAFRQAVLESGNSLQKISQ